MFFMNINGELPWRTNMTDLIWYHIENADTQCFACGHDNPHGLKMVFESNGEKLRSTVTIPEHHRGWSNLVHGGILATMTDEIMSWAAIHLLRRFVLTKKMTTSYLRPVRIGTTLTATGFIKNQINEKSAIMQAEIRNEAGNLCATGEGEFVLFTPEQFAIMNLFPKENLENMTGLFKK